MNSEHESVWLMISRSLLAIIGWFGSIKLAEWQMLVGILSGVIVSGYAATQWYVIWRDKIRGKP